MANTTVTVAAQAAVDHTINQVMVGKGTGGKGSKLKMFKITAGTGNYPHGGFTLDLSALFPTKVLMVVLQPFATATDFTNGYYCMYVPAANNAPATGKMVCFSGATNIELADDGTVMTAFEGYGFGIGY
jgi:hypothetical protein